MKVCGGCAYLDKSTFQLQRKENVINLIDSDDILDKRDKCYIYLEANNRLFMIFFVKLNSIEKKKVLYWYRLMHESKER